MAAKKGSTSGTKSGSGKAAKAKTSPAAKATSKKAPAKKAPAKKAPVKKAPATKAAAGAKASAKAPTKKAAVKKAAAKPAAKTRSKAAPKAKAAAKSNASGQKPAAKAKAAAKPQPANKARAKPKPAAQTKAQTPAKPVTGKATAKTSAKPAPAPKPAASAKPAPGQRAAKGTGQTAAAKAIPSAPLIRPTAKQPPVRDLRPKASLTGAYADPSPLATSSHANPDSPFRNFTPYQPAAGEDYMSEPQLLHFRNILLRWRQDLMEEVDRTVHHMQDEANNFPDPADRATQEEEFSIELRTRDRERKLIRKIDQTIDRIDDSDYGYCDTCGIEIGLRRLEARPTATQCVDCKTLDEIRERQLHG